MSKLSDGKGKSPATGVNRRSLFLMGGSAVATAAIVPLTGGEAVADESQAERVKARYKADSPDVQNYYRVNRY